MHIGTDQKKDKTCNVTTVGRIIRTNEHPLVNEMERGESPKPQRIRSRPMLCDTSCEQMAIYPATETRKNGIEN